MLSLEEVINEVKENLDIPQKVVNDLKEQLNITDYVDFYVLIFAQDEKEFHKEFEYLYCDILTDEELNNLSLEEKKTMLLNDYKIFSIGNDSYLAVYKCFLKNEYK